MEGMLLGMNVVVLVVIVASTSDTLMLGMKEDA
jgi:hypothetical protein